MDPPEQYGQALPVSRHHHEVDVVCHQTKSQNPHFAIRQILLQQREVALAVSDCLEHRLPVGPALGDVKGHSRPDTPCISWHDANQAA
jgi:hypothetical protein